ncbi:MAG TPA: 1,4-alpha-glucan branching protein GlgB [Actinomycetota bacterium]|nr:1,4-alpha-glucan branching protein GlgB [Actinomycetota bacterium]
MARTDKASPPKDPEESQAVKTKTETKKTPESPLVGDLDIHLFSEGRHESLWKHLGAHPIEYQGEKGTWFSVWAPNARAISVIGEFNGWDPAENPMTHYGSPKIWETFVPGAREGQRYKFEIVRVDGLKVYKIDPFAIATEMPPETVGRIYQSRYKWDDSKWMDVRNRSDPHDARISIYECHLGSWRRKAEDGSSLSYREVAEPLADYVSEMGFTHVEFLPLAEHPFGGSWGYQVSAYYAPTARFGEPDDLRYLIDTLHQRGIGVILDWVPAHFPGDEFALSRFDGTALYEHLDPRQGVHPDWDTLVFNLGRAEVRNFLMANALYWLEEFHVDGLRVDAVASMLYLDYSRKAGQWIPNKYGGRENLEAIDFLKEVNTVVYGNHPGVMMIAEESTAWPSVSRPTHLGGLGFGFKWSMGWMNDTLSYFSTSTIHRKYHHQKLTFGLMYAWSESFVLPVSHDEVVHGKGSLLRKMPGDPWKQFANLRALFAWMWAHPGKQLIFMGGEFGQEWEWDHDAELSWPLLEDDSHRGVRDLVAALNRVQQENPAFWELDTEPRGFHWIDANDSEGNVLTFLRFGKEGTPPVACLANFSPVPRPSYRIGLPMAGKWEEILNTDATWYGGSGVSPGEVIGQGPPGWHGLDFTAELTLPPLSVVWLRGPVSASEPQKASLLEEMDSGRPVSQKSTGPAA